MTIEEDLKTIIDAGSFTTITNDCYIWAQSHSVGLNLNKPVIEGANTVVVIHAATSSTITETSASSVIEYVGFITLYAGSIAYMKQLKTDLKTIFDNQDFLIVEFDGNNGNPKVGYYNNRAMYRWKKLVNKG